MADDVSAADGGGERANEQRHPQNGAHTASAPVRSDNRSGDPGELPQGEADGGGKPFWKQLNIREWVTVGASVAAAMAAIASAFIAYWTYGELDQQRVAMVGQLREMQSSSADTKALITAAGS